jgi:YesN/AraC family two-component response regulator
MGVCDRLWLISQSETPYFVVVYLPAEALKTGKSYAHQIHLLMTDVIMPGMNGRDLSNEMNKHFPNLKCLFMSGYTANAIAHHGVLDDGVRFIQKPFSMQDLAEKVRKVLDED